MVADIKISELTSPAQFSPETFTPPIGVPGRPGCMNPKLPRLVERQAPVYPQSARQQRREGTVAFDTIIGMDGLPRFQRVVESTYPDLEDSSKRAVSQWRYEPAICNGQPVEIETVIQVNYTLSH
jgi:TonB family protein